MKSADLKTRKELILQVKNLSEKADKGGEEFLHKVLLAVLDIYKSKVNGDGLG